MSGEPQSGEESASGDFELPRNSQSWLRHLNLRWTIAGVLILFLVLLIIPAVRAPQFVRTNSLCKHRLKTIGLALHQYHEEWGCLPPAYTVDAEGNRLHSWRTIILPYLDQKKLYDSIDLMKPWNDPVNAEAFKTGLSVYSCPASNLEPNLTCYLAIVGPMFAFFPSERRTFEDFKDGWSNTLLVIEVGRGQCVPWMAPFDANEDLALQLGQSWQISQQNHPAGVNVLVADGAIRSLSNQLSPKMLRAMMTIDGGEKELAF